MVKLLTVLVSTIPNSKVFLLKKNVSSKNISVYATFNDQSFNDTLTNDIVSFEQLGPGEQDNALASMQFKQGKKDTFCTRAIYTECCCLRRLRLDTTVNQTMDNGYECLVSAEII